MKLQEELADMDSERKALFTEQDMLMNQQEDLKVFASFLRDG